MASGWVTIVLLTGIAALVALTRRVNRRSKKDWRLDISPTWEADYNRYLDEVEKKIREDLKKIREDLRDDDGHN